MSNAEFLISYLKKFVDVSDEEASLFTRYFKESKIRKGQYVIQPEFTAKYKNFIIEGSFRAFVIDDKGRDHTISFAIPEWWITDVNSYYYQKPATMFVVAMEESIVLQLDYHKEQELKSLNYKYETFFRIMAERAMAFLQKRIISNLSLTAEERYDDFVQKYPKIAFRVPQYALASYLGMTTQFLSLIRKKKAKVNVD